MGFAANYMKALQFTANINNELVPFNFKLSNLSYYDGKGDPKDDTRVLISMFKLYCFLDSVMCQVFPVLL